MNKKMGVYFAVFFACILLLGMVSAQNEFLEGFKSFWNGLLEVINIIAQPVLGTSSNLISQQQGEEILFMKTLLFLIILAVMWSVLEFVPLLKDQTWVIALVSIAASILSTRFLATPGWIQTIMLPYSVLGVAVTSILPLVIYFYFIEKALAGNKTMRKTAWILAAVIFVGLFISRASEFAKATETTTKGLFNPAWMYIITAGICLVFFIADKTIQRAWTKAQSESLQEMKRAEKRAEIREAREILEQQKRKGLVTDDEYNTRNAPIKKQEKEYDLI